MFAARANQENAIYEQQTAAAAKPLNQGVKGLAPKTPANSKAPKTPFKVALNDENVTLKTGGNGKQNGLFGDGKGGKADRSAFVTPAGPRNRAPLGNKTTNAKATAFQTPAAAPQSQDKPSAKPTSPRLRRAKIKVLEAEAEATTAENEDPEPEIEYMPPREIPLPDHPDDWPHDRTYPQFEAKNLTRGWWSEFSAQKDSDEDEEFSDFEEKLKRVQELEEKKKERAKKKVATPVKSVVGLQKATRDPLTAKPVQTVRARSAVSALSKPAGLAAPTAAAKARLPAAATSKKPTSVVTAPGNTRHAAAKAASNSTLGYSKGRAVSGMPRQPLSGENEKQTEDEKPLRTKTSTTLDDLFGLQDLDIGDDDLGVAAPGGLDFEDEASKDFQLEPVEL